MEETGQEGGMRASIEEQADIPAPAPAVITNKHIAILGLVGGGIGLVLTILSTQGVIPYLFLGVGIGIMAATMFAVIVLYLLFIPAIAQNARARARIEGRYGVHYTAERSPEFTLEEPTVIEEISDSPVTEHEVVRGDLSTILEVTSISDDKESNEGVSDPATDKDVSDLSKSESTETGVPLEAELSTVQERTSTSGGKEELSEGVSDPGKERDVEDLSKSASTEPEVSVKEELSATQERTSTSDGKEESSEGVSDPVTGKNVEASEGPCK